SALYYSFFREVKVNGVLYARLYLKPRAGGALRLVTQIRERQNQVVTNDFLGDHYASWTVCTATCTIRVYNIDTTQTRPVPTVHDRPQYASTIDESNGNLFYARSGFGCGVNVSFFVRQVSDFSLPVLKVASLPDGKDLTNVASLSDGDLLYSQVTCRSGHAGIYSLLGVDL